MMAAESDQNHGVSEEIMPDYTREDEDEGEPGRGNTLGNSTPEDGGEGPPGPRVCLGRTGVPV